jgi:hypothetical protein
MTGLHFNAQQGSKERLDSLEYHPSGGGQSFLVLQDSNPDASVRHKKDMLAHGRNFCRKFENRGLVSRACSEIWGVSSPDVSVTLIWGKRSMALGF